MAATTKRDQIIERVVPLGSVNRRAAPIDVMDVKVVRCSAPFARMPVAIKRGLAVAAEIVIIPRIRFVAVGLVRVCFKPLTDFRHFTPTLTGGASPLWTRRVGEIVAAIGALENGAELYRAACFAQPGKMFSVICGAVVVGTGSTSLLVRSGRLICRAAHDALARLIPGARNPLLRICARSAALLIGRCLDKRHAAIRAIDGSVSSHWPILNSGLATSHYSMG